MPRFLEQVLEKAGKSHKSKTGVVCGGFHPKVRLDLTKGTRGEVVELLEKVEQCGEMAAASLHNDVLPDPEECHEREADCADADVDTLVGSIEGARGCDMATHISCLAGCHG